MADSRITLTSTGQYDLLLALSQDSINAALAAMWDLDGDKMTTITINGAKFGMLDKMTGQIGEPAVQVIATGAGRGSVLFRLNFVSGTGHFFNSELEDTEPKSLEGFRVAFKVDIGLENLHREVNSFEEKLKAGDLSPKTRSELEQNLEKARDTVKRFGKSAGDFSIQRLFLDFTTADISSLDKSELVAPGLNPNQVTTFGVLLVHWLTKNKTSGQTTLGYGLAVHPEKKNDYKVANCLMPTSVNLQTYGYLADLKGPPKLGWDGDAGKNALVYCNMTEDRMFEGESLLKWSGNFITDHADKEKRIDGTAVIRRHLFLDKFIIPMLRQYNDDMQIVADTMVLSRDGEQGRQRFHWTYSSILGHHPQHPEYTDPYFNFKENAKGANLFNVNTHDNYEGLGSPGSASLNRKYEEAVNKGFDPVKRAEGASWSWSQRCDTGLKEDDKSWVKGPKYLFDWVNRFVGQNMSYSAVDVVPVPGDGRIKIRGYTVCEVGYRGEIDRWQMETLKYAALLEVGAFWQVDIVISSTEKDGLTASAVNQHAFTFDSLLEEGESNDKVSCRNFINELKGKISTMLEKKESICKAINDALDATGKFTHPAAGEFNFRDPMFNTNGDLLITAQYKAPKKDGFKFNLPAPGEAVKQRDPTNPGQFLSVTADDGLQLPEQHGPGQ